MKLKFMQRVRWDRSYLHQIGCSKADDLWTLGGVIIGPVRQSGPFKLVSVLWDGEEHSTVVNAIHLMGG